MDRQKQLDRMSMIVEGAQTLFLEAGYRRTQMADIAEEIGISPGTIYNYFRSKEALFDFLVRHQVLQLPQSEWPEIPIPTPDPGSTMTFLKTEGRRIAFFPSLIEALERDECDNPKVELETIIRDYYSMNVKYRFLIALVESSALDWPELANGYYKQVVEVLAKSFRQYFEKRIKQGHIKPLPNLEASVRLIWETTAWFARRRPSDPTATKISDKAARDTVVEALLRVFL